jgi:hypothetical protein
MTEPYTYWDAWTELRGYVSEAVTDGGQFRAADVLSYMDELRRRIRASRPPLLDLLKRAQPHTVWYWISDDNDPVPAPFSATFDDATQAEAKAQEMVEQRNDPYNRLRWVKVFRSDNEQYTTWRWTNPDPFLPIPQPPAATTVSPRRRWWKRSAA